MSGRPVEVRARGWGWRHAGRRAWAVRDLDLDIPAGQRVLLLGPSGSGKSTILAGLAGTLAREDSGEATGTLSLDGVPAHEARHRAGLLLQDPDAQLVMNRVGDDVAFGPENHGVPAEQIWPLVDEALRLVGFDWGRDRLTSALSGGEKQRLALAGVLAMHPGLLLLDEPTANLDPESGREVRAAVDHVLAATGATLVVVEHRVATWVDRIDRVIVLGSDATVVADGPPGSTLAGQADALRAAGVWLPATQLSRRVSATPAGPSLVVAEQAGYTHRGAPGPSVQPTDLALRVGELTAIEGRSGSGKSTLATMLAGLAAPSTGSVRTTEDDSQLYRRRPRRLARLVGTVFQNPEHQFVRPTVRQELELAPRLLGWSAGDIEARVEELLDRLRLAQLAEANPFTLSGGQKRRLSVATALVAAPRVLVLDEPTFGQDATTWAELADLLTTVRDDGAALLVVSHDTDFVDTVADRRLRMAAGRLSVAEAVR